MTHPDPDKAREPFEAWARENGATHPCVFVRDPRDCSAYYGEVTQALWNAWQAGIVHAEHATHPTPALDGDAEALAAELDAFAKGDAWQGDLPQRAAAHIRAAEARERDTARVISAVRAFLRCAAEFPDEPGIWGEHLDDLDTAMAHMEARAAWNTRAPGGEG